MQDITLFKVDDALCFKRITKKDELKDVDLENFDGVLIDTSCNEKEARRIMDALKSKKKKIAIVGGDNVFNRRVLDSMHINFLVSPERGEKKDNLKQRDSGLNHVLVKIAKTKNVVIIIDFSEISSLDGKDRALRISRIMQNIEICRKSGCDVKIATLATKKNELRSQKELSSFMTSLGASSQQVKRSIDF